MNESPMKTHLAAKSEETRMADPQYENSVPGTGRMAVIIENVTPSVDGGLHPVKCIQGQTIYVEADIFKDGREVLGAAVKFRKKGEAAWHESPMKFVDNDRWRGEFVPADNARYEYTLEAWVDPVATWIGIMEKKCPVYPNVASDLAEGLPLIADV